MCSYQSEVNRDFRLREVADPRARDFIFPDLFAEEDAKRGGRCDNIYATRHKNISPSISISVHLTCFARTQVANNGRDAECTELKKQLK